MDTFERLFYSGTSGLVLPMTKSNFSKEFEGQSRLQYYSHLFNSVEINSSFYKLPKSTTLIKWAASVPEHFKFTFKVPKSITHSHELKFSGDEINDFMTVMESIGSKKGCLLVQFPPSITIGDMHQVRNLLEVFQKHSYTSSWKLAIEFRNSTWYAPQVYELLKSYDAQLVFHDMLSAPVPKPWPTVEGNFVYIRLHGPEQSYRGDYSDAFLKSVGLYVNEMISQEKAVYVYFNNTMGAALNNLQTLNRQV